MDPAKSETPGPYRRWRRPPWAGYLVAGVVAPALLAPLKDSRPVDIQAEYNQVRQSFLRGQLADSQTKADLDYRESLSRDPEWASRFLLLEAEIMVRRGHYDDALRLLGNFHPDSSHPNEQIKQLTLEGVAMLRQQQPALAGREMSRAQQLCAMADYPACGELLRARGVLAVSQGDLAQARQRFLETLAFADAHRDRFLEATATLNLGWAALHQEHYDEAVDWSWSAYKISENLGSEDLAENSAGNLGWAYFRLGDTSRALDLFLQIEKGAARIGNPQEQLTWLTTAGYVYENIGNFARAGDCYDQALTLARQINSREDIVDSLEVLTHLSIETGQLDEAGAYLEQLAPLMKANPDRLDELDVLLAQGRIAAARGQNAQAESIFRTVAADPASQTSMRLGAEHELAKLDERRGDLAAADRMYATALDAFEQARNQLKKEDSKIPFLTNAAPIYDDYVDLLIKQGRVNQALDLADHSRARTLAAGLGLNVPAQPAALDPGRIAQKTGATLLFYWLGQTQSWLWAITPAKTTLFPLPAQSQIAALVARYRDALLGPDDPLDSANADGIALYNTLIAPAAPLVPPGGNVVVLSDGALSQLNFETLLVPAPHLHYWIEDATVVSAPSLTMLASSRAAATAGRRVLLLGDALSPNPDYPELPKASIEMQEIERHFATRNETVFSGPEANPDSYLSSNPSQYAYIHFVAHGVASLTDPLDSAIILSPSVTGEDSFKLYARSIIQHPLHARLVTISSCYGGGTRTFAGEGLVGLSWAFLRAGAHNVIGALWEVSDDSTPVLMDELYAGLEQGLPPSVALRQAQLTLLRGKGDYRNPFFWAPFQIYTGL